MATIAILYIADPRET